MAHRATTRTVAAAALAFGALTVIGGGVATAAPAPQPVPSAVNVASTITIEPITGATVEKEITLKAKVTPAAAGGTVVFENSTGAWNPVPVGADGTATTTWRTSEAGKQTLKATFSGRNGVTGSTTTREVTIKPAGDNGSSTGIDSVDSVLDKIRSLFSGLGS
ncbi:Ig-like domain repeat protein [Rhodococcus sp. NPDC055112]